MTATIVSAMLILYTVVGVITSLRCAHAVWKGKPVGTGLPEAIIIACVIITVVLCLWPVVLLIGLLGGVASGSGESDSEDC